MHITCDMAMDLAGLYKDGLASADSTRAVEQHLKECPSCRRYYRNFRPESQHSASQVKITGQLPAEPIEQEWRIFLTESIAIGFFPVWGHWRRYLSVLRH